MRETDLPTQALTTLDTWWFPAAGTLIAPSPTPHPNSSPLPQVTHLTLCSSLPPPRPSPPPPPVLREEARAKAAAARRHIQEHFSPRMLAAAVSTHLQRIQRLLVAREGKGAGASA